MVSRNNQRFQDQRLYPNQHQRFGLRKLSVGVASVLLGTAIYMSNSSVVHADTLAGGASADLSALPVEKNQQSAISNQQSAISNQQSALKTEIDNLPVGQTANINLVPSWAHNIQVTDNNLVSGTTIDTNINNSGQVSSDGLTLKLADNSGSITLSGNYLGPAGTWQASSQSFKAPDNFNGWWYSGGDGGMVQGKRNLDVSQDAFKITANFKPDASAKYSIVADSGDFGQLDNGILPQLLNGNVTFQNGSGTTSIVDSYNYSGSGLTSQEFWYIPAAYDSKEISYGWRVHWLKVFKNDTLIGKIPFYSFMAPTAQAESTLKMDHTYGNAHGTVKNQDWNTSNFRVGQEIPFYFNTGLNLQYGHTSLQLVAPSVNFNAGSMIKIDMPNDFRLNVQASMDALSSDSLLGSDFKANGGNVFQDGSSVYIYLPKGTGQSDLKNHSYYLVGSFNKAGKLDWSNKYISKIYSFDEHSQVADRTLIDPNAAKPWYAELLTNANNQVVDRLMGHYYDPVEGALNDPDFIVMKHGAAYTSQNLEQTKVGYGMGSLEWNERLFLSSGYVHYRNHTNGPLGYLTDNSNIFTVTLNSDDVFINKLHFYKGDANEVKVKVTYQDGTFDNFILTNYGNSGDPFNVQEDSNATLTFIKPVKSVTYSYDKVLVDQLVPYMEYDLVIKDKHSDGTVNKPGTMYDVVRHWQGPSQDYSDRLQIYLADVTESQPTTVTGEVSLAYDSNVKLGTSGTVKVRLHELFGNKSFGKLKDDGPFGYCLYYVLPKSLHFDMSNAGHIVASSVENSYGISNKLVPDVSTYSLSDGRQVVKVDYSKYGFQVNWQNDAYSSELLLDPLATYRPDDTDQIELAFTTTNSDFKPADLTASYPVDSLLAASVAGQTLYGLKPASFNVLMAKQLMSVIEVAGNSSENPGPNDTVDDKGPNRMHEFISLVNNGAIAINHPKLIVNLDDPRSNSFDFVLDGPATLSGVLANSQSYKILYSIKSNATKDDLASFVTASNITDWSKVRSILVTADVLPPQGSVGKLKLTGHDFHNLLDDLNKVYAPSTILYSDMDPNGIAISNDLNGQLTITGYSKVQLEAQFVDGENKIQTINLVTKLFKDGTDQVTLDALTRDVNLPKGLKINSTTVRVVSGPLKLGQISMPDIDGSVVLIKLDHVIDDQGAQDPVRNVSRTVNYHLPNGYDNLTFEGHKAVNGVISVRQSYRLEHVKQFDKFLNRQLIDVWNVYDASVSTDQVVGQVYPMTNNQYSDRSFKYQTLADFVIPGYELNQPISSSIVAPNSGNQVIDVMFNALPQQVRINYVDLSGQVVATSLVHGVTDQVVTIPTLPSLDGWVLYAGQDFGSNGTSVKLVNGINNYDYLIKHVQAFISSDDNVNSTDIIKGTQAKTYGDAVTADKLNRTITRTIVVHKPYDEQPTTYAQSVRFRRNAILDAVTGQVTYTAWSENGRHVFSECLPATFDNYSADPVTAVTVTPDSLNTTVEVKYMPVKRQSYVQFVDENGKNIGDKVAIDNGTITLTAPKGYQLATVLKTLTVESNSDRIFSVMVRPDIKTYTAHDTLPVAVTKPVTKTVTRTVVITQPNGRMRKIVQKVKFERTATVSADGTVTYGDWHSVERAQFNKVFIPKKFGYRQAISNGQQVLTGVDKVAVTADMDDQTIVVSYVK